MYWSIVFRPHERIRAVAGDFSRGKGTIFRIPASSLMSYGLVGLPVLNPDVPNYGQIRPAIPMNVGTFRALIQSTAPAWQPVK